MRGFWFSFLKTTKCKEETPCFRGRLLPLRGAALPAPRNSSRKEPSAPEKAQAAEVVPARCSRLIREETDIKSFRSILRQKDTAGVVLTHGGEGCKTNCTTRSRRKSSSRRACFRPPSLTLFLPSEAISTSVPFTVFPRNFCQLLSHTQKSRYWHGGVSKKSEPPHLPTAASFFFAMDTGFVRH